MKLTYAVCVEVEAESREAAAAFVNGTMVPLTDGVTRFFIHPPNEMAEGGLPAAHCRGGRPPAAADDAGWHVAHPPAPKPEEPPTETHHVFPHRRGRPPKAHDALGQ